MTEERNGLAGFSDEKKKQLREDAHKMVVRHKVMMDEMTPHMENVRIVRETADNLVALNEEYTPFIDGNFDKSVSLSKEGMVWSITSVVNCLLLLFGVVEARFFLISMAIFVICMILCYRTMKRSRFHLAEGDKYLHEWKAKHQKIKDDCGYDWRQEEMKKNTGRLHDSMDQMTGEIIKFNEKLQGGSKNEDGE